MDYSQTILIRWFKELGMDDVPSVGGKNASLGEMAQNLTPLGIKVPDGFATTAEAYRMFIKENELEEPIREELKKLNEGSQKLEDTGLKIRELIHNGIFPISIAESIREAYDQLCGEYEMENIRVAVRSSATAEDLPTASFAGQHDTYLNIRGKEQLLEKCKDCYASLFTDRAISYRREKGFDHMEVALSVGVQRMIKADEAGSGVMFTLDTETGFPDVVLINAAWGLGENIVQGTINPDQYLVFKPLLENKELKPILEKKLGSKELKMVYASNNGDRTINNPTTRKEQVSFVLGDDEIIQLARWASKIEQHYEKPMDIEWVKDDKSDQLFIVQARPETIHASASETTFKSYRLLEEPGKPIVKGISIGGAIAQGRVRKINDISELESVEKGDIMVTEMTEPDWVPALKKSSGIITNSGGRTCHAAIVSRELGIPAVVGTGSAMKVLKDGDEITLSCAGGDEGAVYKGHLEFEERMIDLEGLPDTDTEVMINLAAPESAFKWWKLPVKGVGLARMEFIIGNHIKIHPMALVNFDKVLKEADREKVRKITRGYRDKSAFFVDRLRDGIAKIAASQYPHPVIVRTSDFKTDEYAGLIGGEDLELDEENPMLGWRGASRYYSEGYREGFALECKALKQVREEIGLDNVIVMIPFCRTIQEAKWVLEEMEKNGLTRGENGLQVYMMSEVPSNVILAEQFAQYFDGFSIGSNDLTQLTLGVDRNSSELNYLFDENDEAVKLSVQQIIERAHKHGRKVGLCGQAPSDDPEYAAFLVQSRIDSMSVNPDSVLEVLRHIHQAEQNRTDVTI